MNEFRNLIDDWLSGEVSPDAGAKLNHLLCENQENARQFAEELSLHYALREVLLEEANVPQVLSEFLCRSSVSPRTGKKLPRSLIAVILATAVLVAIPVLVFRSVQRTNPTAAIQEVPADLSSVTTEGAVDVAIVESCTDDSAGSCITPGARLKQGERFQLFGGTVRLRFLAGVEMDVTSPASMEFVSPLKVVLLSGRLVATVEEQARGFTVVTPRADVIDLGTKFGVNVNQEGDSDVVVFSGAVDVHYTKEGHSERQVQRLSVGEALRVRAFGALYPLTVIQKGVEQAKWAAEINDSACAIARVTDNFIGPDQPIYYGIVPGGFNEDAQAYVDRPYQWNSLPGVPFPEPLRGGDYIQMFNSLKFVFNLKLQVQLRCDANVYVVLDERIPTPGWLQADFEKTEYRIGIDEYQPNAVASERKPSGPVLDSIRSLGVGPGESVDAPYCIWKCHRPADSVVTFGSLHGAIPDELQNQKKTPWKDPRLFGSMYGIVIVASPSNGSPARN